MELGLFVCPIYFFNQNLNLYANLYVEFTEYATKDTNFDILLTWCNLLSLISIEDSFFFFFSPLLVYVHVLYNLMQQLFIYYCVYILVMTPYYALNQDISIIFDSGIINGPYQSLCVYVPYIGFL